MLRSISHRARRRLGDPKGANLIEAALILPLILHAMFAILEFGTILWVHMALQNGVSQATRFAITGDVLAGQSREESIKSIMRQETPTLTLADGDFSFSHMLAGGNTWLAGTGPPTSIERLSVDYSWPVLTPFLRPFFSGNAIDFSVESAMKNEGDIEL